MPSIPEYILKYDELTVMIGKYVNLLPFNPEDLRYESSLYNEIRDQKSILDVLIVSESPDVKKMVNRIFNYFLEISELWNTERETMNY